MKVLHISGARSWGGNEQQLVYLIEALQQYGVSQFLFCYKGTVLEEAATKLPAQVIAIPYVKSRKKAYRKQLSAVVKEKEIDLLHLHTSDSVTGYVLTDLYEKLNVKVVFSKKGISRKVSFLSKLKYNYKNIDKVLCVSEKVKDHFATVLYAKYHYKLCVVHDGVAVDATTKKEVISLREELSLPEHTRIIGNIANHTKAKDLKTLIHTLDNLVNKKKNKDVHLVQMGESSKRTQELKDQISSFGLASYITFIGFRKDASAYLPQFDVYLMTSEREGGPTTVLEALYKRTSVVSTDVGVVSEAITDGQSGYIAKVGDPETLAEKVEILLNDPEKRKSFATLAYDSFLKTFTTKKLGENTFNIYKEVMHEN